MDNQLIIGVILIVVGIALALLAYAFVLNRRDQERESQAAPEDEPTAAEPDEEAPLQAGTPPPWVIPPAAAIQTPVTPEPPPVATPAPTPLPVPAAPPSPQIPEPARLAPSRRTLAVATLMRDEVTGKLLVLVGGREYSTADELRASRDFARVEYAAADLVKWLGVTTVRERVAERVATEEVKKPASMIEQINEILQRKLAEASGASRGVRLLEGAGGSLRVFIGVQSYTFEDVPDDDVKRIIREAVAEWEAKQ